jgi:hypothetical protein
LEAESPRLVGPTGSASDDGWANGKSNMVRACAKGRVYTARLEWGRGKTCSFIITFAGELRVLLEPHQFLQGQCPSDLWDSQKAPSLKGSPLLNIAMLGTKTRTHEPVGYKTHPNHGVYTCLSTCHILDRFQDGSPSILHPSLLLLIFPTSNWKAALDLCPLTS